MKRKKITLWPILILSLGFSLLLKAQIPSNVYHSIEKNGMKNTTHELKIDDDYLIYSIFETNPAVFIKTVGGFYTSQNNQLVVKLEFNSNYENDALAELKIPYTIKGDQLELQFASPLRFKKSLNKKQDLDGAWLFATRGPDTGQERRGDDNPRKTLKFLKDGYFQWIAYNTETMEFSGTGGGTFTSKDGVYIENIQYFSRDNARVGASLNFNYELKDTDWHHTGKNSKGEPMYEIWARRE